MSNKCFITKLPSSVDNSNLLKLGEMVIHFDKSERATFNSDLNRGIYIETSEPITATYVGNGNFTDVARTKNTGKEITGTALHCYVTADECDIHLSNKYKIKALKPHESWGISLDKPCFNTKDLRYSYNLESFDLWNTAADNTKKITINLKDFERCNALSVLRVGQSSGSLSSLIGLPLKVLHVVLKDTNNINSISGLTNLTNLALSGNISGDLSSISGLTNLTDLALTGNISGDLSSISGLTNLISLALTGNISGDLSSISGLTNLDYLYIRNVPGDLSKLPPKVAYIDLYGCKLTYTKGGRSKAELMSGTNLVFNTADDEDNYLIDSATCTISSGNIKSITIYSSKRTSASDSAVNTLQNSGVTVTLNK